MIHYNQSAKCSSSLLFGIAGSVFPWAAKICLPVAIVMIVTILLLDDQDDQYRASLKIKAQDQTLMASFTFVLGFLMVWRMQEAYSRFKICNELAYQMMGDWSVAAYMLCAFASASGADVTKFKHLIARLFSLMNGLALGQLEEVSESYQLEASESKRSEWKRNVKVLDGRGLCDRTIYLIMNAERPVDLAFYWLTLLICEHYKSGTFSIPGEILTRAFEEMSLGMTRFHEQLKIVTTPIPFAVAQMTLYALCLQTLLLPLMVLAQSPPWLSVFGVFVVNFFYWCLFAAAIELENPFGRDPCDLDIHSLQAEMNDRLLMLFDAPMLHTPALSPAADMNLNRQSIRVSQLYQDMQMAAEKDEPAGAQVESTTSFNMREDMPNPADSTSEIGREPTLEDCFVVARTFMM